MRLKLQLAPEVGGDRVELDVKWVRFDSKRLYFCTVDGDLVEDMLDFKVIASALIEE